MPNGSIGRYLVAFLAAYLLTRQSKKYESAGSENCAQTSEKEQRKPDVVRVHVANDGWPTDNSRHQSNEVKYWRASILISFLALAAAVGAAFFAGGAYIAAKDQAAQAKRQADDADTALKEGNQPLIATSGIKWSSPLVKDTDNGIRVMFANIGKSPTLFYNVGSAQRYDIDIGSFDYDSIDVGEHTFCDVVANFRQPTSTAFPSPNLANLNSGMKVDKTVVNDLLDATKKVTVVVQGCIFYKDGDDIRSTGYCYIAAQGSKLADPSNTPICAKGNFNR